MRKLIRIALITAIGTLALSSVASAHEVWIEKDATGPARVYLGEPDSPMPEGGDPEFHRLTSPTVFQSDPKARLATVRKEDHLAIDSSISGDIRLIDDAVFDAWNSDGKTTAAIFYARAGRQEPVSYMDFEIVPTEPYSDIYTVLFRNSPVANAHITVIAPGRWHKTFSADASGRFAAPYIGPGRYILSSIHTEDVQAEVNEQNVDAIMHITTATIVKE